MFLSVIGFIIGFILLNGFCWLIQSPMRFGWYNKDDAGQGRVRGKYDL